jgi:hypothetical protein
MENLPFELCKRIIPRHRWLWCRQISHSMREKIETIEDLDFFLSDLGCKHVTAEFFLRFVRGISSIRCSAVAAVAQHLNQWMQAVVDAVHGGLIITKIKIDLCDSEFLQPLACIPILTHRPHLVLMFHMQHSSEISEQILSILSTKFRVEMRVSVHHDDSFKRQRGKSARLGISMRRVAFPQALTTLQIRCMMIVIREPISHYAS